MLKVAIQIMVEDLDNLEEALQDIALRIRRNKSVPFAKHLISNEGTEAAIAIRELRPDEKRPAWSVYHQTQPIN